MKRILVVTALDLALAASACACGGARANAPPPGAPIASAAPAPAATVTAPQGPGPTSAKDSGEQTIQGELVDLACYLDHGAKGEHHKACATSCALSGLPIGLLDKDNKITIVIGVHDKPMNTELADKMSTTVRLTGKVVSRDGMQMIEVSHVE